MNFATFSTFDKLTAAYNLELENYSLQNQIDSQASQYTNDIKLTAELRQYRHDMINYLLSVHAQLEEGNISGAQNSINEKIGQFQETRQLSNTGYYSLDSIINYKAGIAAENGISCDYLSNISVIPTIKECDICILIGVALDNSIEYLKQHVNVTQVISIEIVSNNIGFIVSISNQIDSIININSNNTITSTKGDINHGLGLKMANSIIQKYNGELFLSTENNIFKFRCILHHM